MSLFLVLSPAVRESLGSDLIRGMNSSRNPVQDSEISVEIRKSMLKSSDFEISYMSDPSAVTYVWSKLSVTHSAVYYFTNINISMGWPRVTDRKLSKEGA